MIKMSKKSFTLLELMLVVVIVGIIATFAIPGYLGVRQRAEQRQASAQIRLIQAAENIGFLENSAFTACAGFAACNAALDLDLPNDGWVYNVALIAGPDFNATANGGAGCVYQMNRNTVDPVVVGACAFIP